MQDRIKETVKSHKDLRLAEPAAGAGELFQNLLWK
jgi:hypothetical protein